MGKINLKEENFSESITDLIIATIGSSRNTKVFKKILHERKLARYKRASVSVGISRLQSKGYLKKSSLGWSVTKAGEKYAKEKHLLSYIPSPFKKGSPAGIIISFDIPQQKRLLRNWLRNQIKVFGYKIIQQSLWVGPGPLPKEFLVRLENLNIKNNVKIFKVNKING